MGILIETVKTDRFSMNFFRFGTGEKTLVILPGLSVQSVMGAAEEIAEKLDDRPDFRLYLYTGYGHAAFDTAPDYRQRILRFFERSSAGMRS